MRRLAPQEHVIATAEQAPDRRGILITLTPKGLELIDALTAAHLDNEREILAALSGAEQDRLARLLRKLQLGLPPS